MTSGKRDERVAVYSDTGTTVDAVGQAAKTASLVGTFWAQVQRRSGLAFSRASQMQANSEYLVTFLANSLTRAIDPFNTYFTWRGVRLNPVSNSQPRYRDLEIEFECEEKVGGV